MIDANDPLTAPTARTPRRSTSPKVTTPKRGGLAKGKQRSGIKVERVFSDAKRNPYDEIEWDTRTAEITDEGGKIIFKQEDVEVPKNWSQLATKVVVSKYFFGQQGTPERETSVRQLIHRVARTIADWGVNDGYFSRKDGEVFYEELSWLCLKQYGAFNSPVWFNVGLPHE